MATGAAGDGLFRSIYDGCISGNDMGIQQRPYHRNCSCALHKSRGHCSHFSSKSKVSYKIRRAWSENCLAVMVSGQTSPSTPPIGEIGIGRTNSNMNFALLSQDDDDDDQ